MDDKLTIKDIAEMAQVSKGTVSKALNNQPGVGQATKERILKLVKQLDFHPNSAAQALASNRTENLGLIIPYIPHDTISGSYWSAIISGIAEKANSMGYNILLFTIDKNKDLFETYNFLLKRKRVDGFIVGTELLDSKSINALFSSNIPFVLLGQSQLLKHYYVDVNNYDAAYKITTYMINKGYKKIAFLSGPKHLSYMVSRLEGYRDAIKAENLNFTFEAYSNFTQKEAVAAIDIILNEKPDAILVSAGGEFLFDTLDEINRMNIKVPELGLASFDDYQFMTYITPKVTSIKQPFNELGGSAVEMLCQIIEKGEPDSKEIIHSTVIIPRESCGETLK